MDVVVGKGPGATAIPWNPTLHPGWGDHSGWLTAGRCATALASPSSTSTTPPHWNTSCTALQSCLQSSWSGRCHRDRPPLSRHSRIANRLLRRVRDYAQVRADGRVTRSVAQDALELYEVDELGLDRLDRSVLNAMCRRFGGGPVGLSTLAISVGEERETVEEVAEPFLVREGFLMRSAAELRPCRLASPGPDAHSVPGVAAAPDLFA